MLLKITLYFRQPRFNNVSKFYNIFIFLKILLILVSVSDANDYTKLLVNYKY